MGKHTSWIIIRHENDFLLARRSVNVKNSGQWNFFGGTVDPQENIWIAALRECNEEAGFFPELHLISFLRSVQNGEDTYSYFVYTPEERFDPILNDEHDAFAWVSREELKNNLSLHKPTALWVKTYM